MRRWISASALLLTLLANGLPLFGCLQAMHVGEQSDESVPDCCRNGMCPHHAAEKQACRCDLFSDKAASSLIFSVTPATFVPPIVTAIVLAPVATTIDASLGNPA